jgi:hypothetical protein
VQFVISWKPEALLGINVEVTFVDAELKVGDGLFMDVDKCVDD